MSKPHDIFAALIYLLYKVMYKADKNVDSSTRDFLGLNPSTTPSQLLHELGQVKLLSVRKALPLSVVMKIYELSYIKHTH